MGVKVERTYTCDRCGASPRETYRFVGSNVDHKNDKPLYGWAVVGVLRVDGHEASAQLGHSGFHGPDKILCDKCRDALAEFLALGSSPAAS